MTDVTQRDNSVAGDQAGGNINKAVLMLPSTPSAITELNEQYLAENASERNLQSFIDELNHFSVSLPYAKKDLSTKLTEGSRLQELPEALFLKERITKRILILSKSAYAQQILAFALGKLKQSYLHKVYPEIIAGATQTRINGLIYDEVLTPAFNFLEINPLNLSDDDLKAMIYFLSGNCHIGWA